LKALTTLKLHFFSAPFLPLTLCFGSGILLGFENQNSSLLFFSLFLIAFIYFAVSLLAKLPSTNALYLSIFVSFFSLGALSVHDRLGLLNEARLDTTYREFDPLQVDVLEVGNSTSDWVKIVGKAKFLFHNEKKIKLNESIVLYVKNDGNLLLKGDVLLVNSNLNKIKNNENPGEFDAESYWSKKGILYTSFVGEDDYKLLEHQPSNWIVNAMESCRVYLSNALSSNLKGKELAIAQALILGDKSLLDQEVKNSFTNTGAMHVLAVSGLHIGIIMQILMVVLGYFPKVISRKKALTAVLIVMWIYAFITGLSPSVVRAVFMFSVLVIAQLFGKQYHSINALFFTGFALCLVDPFVIYDIGFQLSFLAMLGIFLLYKPIGELIYIENKWIRKVWEGTAIGFAAQLMTTPLSLYYFHQFPNYFILTNIGLMASSGLILGAGVFLFATSWWKALSKITGIVLTWVIFLSLAFIEWVEGLPGGVAYGFTLSLMTVAGFTFLVLILFLLVKNKRHQSLGLGLGFVLLTLIVFDRFQNMSNNEFCVFNSKQVVFVVKNDQNLFCFYKAKKEDFDKVEKMVDAYRKIYPAEVHYFDLTKKNYSVSSKSLKVKTTKNGANWEVKVNNKEYALLTDYDSNTSLKGKRIVMPYIESSTSYELSKGAYRAKL
jgi:competence protein ComEC